MVCRTYWGMRVSSVVKFNFDQSEALNAFLTPVYFDHNVLVKYLYDPRISVEFASESYGTIYLPDKHLAFGINSAGTVIAWHGDLEDLDAVDQYHWANNNIESQHDVKSEWYDGQINVAFTPPPVSIQAINALDKWNAAFATKYGTRLYKPTSFDDRLEAVRRYRRIIIQSEDDFIRFVSELNEIINENVDTQGIRALLSGKGVKIDNGSRGNKLIELVYRDILGDTTNMIAPFFWLYDVRLWADHDMGDAKLIAVAAHLGVDDIADYEAILTRLLIKLRDAATNLHAVYG